MKIAVLLFFALITPACAATENADKQITNDASVVSAVNPAESERATNGLLTKSVEDFALSDDKRIENQKLPLTFKLVYGNSYPVCKEYVDMLNAAKYMGYPACERKILPGFPQFSAVQWVEITDKAEIERIMQERLSMVFASYGKLDSHGYTDEWRYTRKKIMSGENKLYQATIDMNKDGKKEIVYKMGSIFPQAEKYATCKNQNRFYVDDKSITMQNPQDYDKAGYLFLSTSDDSNLFFKNNNVYRDIWTRGSHAHDILVYTINKKMECGINIQ